jgi:hypothetical protein
MDLIIFADGLYHLVPVTKTMLSSLEIPKDVHCLDLCDIIIENFIFKQEFFGCYCLVE